MTSADQLHRALALHRGGHIEEAIEVYRALLVEQNEDPDLHHLLALALNKFSSAAARAELRRALVLAPAIGLYLHNAARLADPSEQNALARQLFRALTVDPLHAIAQHRLGALDARAGRLAPAARRFRYALVLDPTLLPALFDHANLAADMRQIEVARRRYVRLLAVKPDDPDGLINLGGLLFRRGLWSDAEAIFSRLVRCAPDRFDAWAALGATYAQQGALARATACIRSALALNPAAADSWHTLASALLKDPAMSMATLCATGRAIWLDPTTTSPHITRSIVLFNQGRMRDAIAARRDVLSRAADDAQAHYEFLPFLHLDPDLNPAAQLAFRRDVHRRFSDPLTRQAASHPNDPTPDRRLRIGYVDNRMLFRSTHSTNLLPMVEAHDPAAVSLHLYTNLPEAEADDMTRRYAVVATRFRHTDGLSDAAVADLVRTDGIDILIDVSGHLTGARTGVFARKPAPIQVTMLQVGSSGLTAMDYAVADPVLLPPNQEDFFTETVIRLPVGFLFEPVADLTPPILQPSPGDRPVTFGSLNLLAKISDGVLALWAKVLAAVPGSRLLLKAAGLACPATRARIAGVFANCGIDPVRLELRAWTQDYAGHLSTFDEIDIALDCFPYPGMTTSLEALLMGVPVVTLAGDRFVGRIGEAILQTVGHPEWIARDADAYVAIAAMLADNPQQRSTLRKHLRDELLASAFGNPRNFTRNLEAALRGAWRCWCEKRMNRST